MKRPFPSESFAGRLTALADDVLSHPAPPLTVVRSTIALAHWASYAHD